MPNLLPELEGLKFPDEMVTRFFFKNGLQRTPGRVLELGCGNANNLALFGAYGWHCAGLDLVPQLIEQGQRNFARQGLAAPQLVAADLNDALPEFGALDVLLLPSSLYYVSPRRAAELLAALGPTLRPGGQLFCRFRTRQDHRYGKGSALPADEGAHCFRLDIAETSEQGCVNAFYDLPDMLSLLAPCRLLPASLRVMELVFDNLGRDDRMIRNHELVLWAEAGPLASDAAH